MSKAKIVNAPRLELFTVARGGDSGEKTLGVFFAVEDAWDCLQRDIISEWGDDLKNIHFSYRDGIMKKIEEHMKDFPLSKDGYQNYLYNGSGCLPQGYIETFSSVWWWVTKHYVDIPDNMIVR